MLLSGQPRVKAQGRLEERKHFFFVRTKKKQKKLCSAGSVPVSTLLHQLKKVFLRCFFSKKQFFLIFIDGAKPPSDIPDVALERDCLSSISL
jgi:hypothetical protein